MMHLINIILHLDKYLLFIIQHYNHYIYLLLFLVIFCETGLVVTPFLPGDSLLFVAGSFAGANYLSITTLAIIIFIAVFCGDNCNFFIGKFIGDKLFSNPKSKIFKRSYLIKTHQFFELHGQGTIILARFVPIIRTFAPFVAGLGYMPYKKFIGFSLIASLLWVLILLGGGYLFGNIPIIKSNLALVIIIVTLLSVIPIIKMILQEILRKKNTSKAHNKH